MGEEKPQGRSAATTAEAVNAARRELNLAETATRKDITRHYRELTRKWHPDVCGEDADLCRERMRRLTAAKGTLEKLVSTYRYSFRSADVRRDQESPAVRYRRQFGEWLAPTGRTGNGEPERAAKLEAGELSAETVRGAAEALGLGETATRNQVQRAYRRLVPKWHPDRRPDGPDLDAEARFREIQWAYGLLRDYIERYRYSFRPADVRRDQEGPFEQHRRQFGRDPSWDF